MARSWARIAKKVDAALTSIQDTDAPQKGRGTIVRKGTPTGPAYDPVPGVDTLQGCNVLYSEFTAMEINGTQILASDLKVVIGVTELAIEPTTSDRFVDSQGKDFEIVKVWPLRPAGVTVLYELQCRA